MVETIRIEFNESQVKAELANTFFSKSMGCRFRSEGKMFFSFSRDTNALIDMMLVPESLYLYFIDSDKQVIEIQKAEPWTLDPRTWKLYRPEKSYRYLLESFEQLDLNEGDRLEFEV